MAISKNKKPVIGITMGDPAGIGPEIIAKSLRNPSLRKSARFQMIGNAKIFANYFKQSFPHCSIIDISERSHDKIRIAHPNAVSAEASFQYLQVAVDLLKKKEIDALVTGPVCKEAISSLGHGFFSGHTEFLADSFAIKNFDMMFVCSSLKTVVVTRHIPLSDVSKALSKEKIYKTIELVNNTLKKIFKIKRPCIAICGLNPHAGEGGSIGKEEITKIIPAIKKARKNRINAQGPFPADTIFSPEIARKFDIVVTMYHDQGTIPVKTLAFNGLVNFTIGLPFIRTSPAHGTAFNIAGKNRANPSSMMEAIKLAVMLASKR